MDRKVVCFYCIVCVSLLSVLLNVAFILNRCHPAERTAYDTTRVTVVDTITYVHPVAKDSVVLRYEEVKVAVSPECPNEEGFPTLPPVDGLQAARSDSVRVALPVTQRRYDDSTYTAWVSGFRARLDSIRVYPRTEIVRERSYKPPNKWHIGITGGYGYGFKSKQAEPYIGIGITYSIISFAF